MIAITPEFNDNSSLLVINPQGILRRLYAPFKVQCILPIDNIGDGVWVYVEGIKAASDNELLYQIHGKEYRHFHFCISIGF